MEIDFLGLNSNKYTTTHQDSSKDSFPDTWKGGVETSLSLCSSCLFDSQTNNENKQQQQQKQNWDLPGDSLSHYSQGSSSSRAGQPGLVLVSRPGFVSPPRSPFLYNLNDSPRSRKNMPELSSDPNGLRMFYPGSAVADKGTHTSPAIQVPADASTRTRGYTPTVAMARKATLARFLEKRLHRMNQARTTHLMGKLLNTNNPEEFNSSSSDTIISRTSNKKKRHDSIIRL